MLRGCQRNIIHIKDTENRIFEEAYFVLRRGVADKKDIPGEDEMLREAGKLINASLPFIYPAGKRRRILRRYAFAFGAGVLSCSIVFGLMIAVL